MTLRSVDRMAIDIILKDAEEALRGWAGERAMDGDNSGAARLYTLAIRIKKCREEEPHDEEVMA